MYTVFYTEDLFEDFSESDLPIYLGLIGEEIKFSQVPVRNRYFEKCPSGSDQEFQILV